jgi:hypothetical protein
MVNKNKQEKQNPTPVAVVSELKCTHPPHMKCIRCLTADKKAGRRCYMQIFVHIPIMGSVRSVSISSNLTNFSTY